MLIAAKNFLHESTEIKDFVPMNVPAMLVECAKLNIVRFAAKCFRLSNHAEVNTARLSVTMNHDGKNSLPSLRRRFCTRRRL